MTMFDRRSVLLGGAAAMLAGSGRAMADDEPMVLYNGQHRQTTESVVKAFTEATGRKVTIRQGESSALANQIIEEGANSPADMFFSEQSPPIAALDEKGLLAPASAEAVRQIPADYASADKTWLGTSLRSRVLVYNKASVGEADLPRSILDVATPAWADRVGYVIRDGFQEQVMAIAKLKGRDAALGWLKGLKQHGRLYNGNGAAMQAVERGEVPTALVNNYYWFGIAKERGPEAMKSGLHYFPKSDPGALINLSPAGVLKTAKRPEAAQALLAFMVSQPGQKAIVTPYAEYPVRPDVTSPYPLKPLAEIQGSVTPSDVGSAQLAYALMREAGML